MRPQTYAWEWGHPQFDPDNFRDWADFEKKNPYVTGIDLPSPSVRRVPGTSLASQPVSTAYPNYPY